MKNDDEETWSGSGVGGGWALAWLVCNQFHLSIVLVLLNKWNTHVQKSQGQNAMLADGQGGQKSS